MSLGAHAGASIPAGLHQVLSDLADQLIPAAGEMPAAGSVLSAKGVTRVLDELPDLAEPAIAALRKVDSAPGEDAIALLVREDPDGLAAVGEIVAAAYFLVPAVAARLGYWRRQAVPIRFEEDLVDLVRPVITRGWPPTAGGEEGGRVGG